MTEQPVLWNMDERGVGWVTLNRPHRGNAYNGELIQGLHDAMDSLGGKHGLRAVVIKGNGNHFQAGADLVWLNEVRVQSPRANLDASRAACDVVIASEDAKFAISEARWGVTAAVIVPHLVDAIGARQVRRYALTCERFDAREAQALGLVHEVVARDQLEAKGDEILDALLECGPDAIAETKSLTLRYSHGGLSGGEMETLIEIHSAKRQSAEAGEGLASFAEKRSASWSPKS